MVEELLQKQYDRVRGGVCQLLLLALAADAMEEREACCACCGASATTGQRFKNTGVVGGLRCEP
jgi:thymidine kinase